MQITKDNLDFLQQLKENNNREWFNKNKALYQKNHEEVIAFAEALLLELNKHDQIETISGKKSLHRIYRDTRFSKDKTPYKASWSGGFKRATKQLRGGYFFKIETDKAWLAGGFWGPSSADLKLIREAIAADADEFRSVINSKEFKNYFGELKGEAVKTAPKGYAKDHPQIDLLRMKQFLVVKEFPLKTVLSKDFHKKVNEGFQNMRPFFDVMSEFLTTDANGEPLY
ncbi:MAG: DUF2461 domain-containing protein [Flavobacteriales bacterium]|nr:DUF2461 domain-containing protein [Flavobacteriales bacterium]